jgi:hypothetical protein
MAISSEYKNVLRELAIKDFVRTNRRSPTSVELNELVLEMERKYYAVDEIGISGFDVTKPKFRQNASAAVENENRQAFFYDMMTLNTKLDHLIDTEESAYRGASSTINRVNKTLDELIERLDNLLLIYGRDDLFLHGIEETFSHQLFIDRVNTTVSIEPANCTLGKRRLESVDLSQVKMKITPITDKAYVSYEANSPVTSLKEDDGNIWRAKVKTTYQLGRVSLLLELSLPEATDVSVLKLSTLPVESNKIMTCTTFYSTNGSSFNPVEPVEQRVTGSLIIPVNALGVKKVQILLSKEAADTGPSTANEYEYLFLLDKVSLEESSFELSDRSTLIAGPYDIVDTSGSAVYFTKSTLKACTIEPEGTAVAFYVSNNGTDYHSIDHTGKTTAFVTFGDHTPDQALGFVDDSASGNSLIERLDLTEEFDVATEAYLNAYITADYADLVPARNIIMKRNIVNSDSADTVLGTVPGWVLDKIKGTYSTTVYISNPEGRALDFGPKGLLLNGQSVTGEQWLKQGYSTIVTDSSNWVEITPGLDAETAVIAVDPLYPYNHRYLLEGYSYPGYFVGEKPYQGCDEYFGRYLSYISPEEFDALDQKASTFYDVFTLEEVDDKLYFKVKVDKRSSTWSSEFYDLDFVVQSTKTNQLWVKAVLSSNDNKLTPTVESFKVRVV